MPNLCLGSNIHYENQDVKNQDNKTISSRKIDFSLNNMLKQSQNFNKKINQPENCLIRQETSEDKEEEQDDESYQGMISRKSYRESISQIKNKK